MNRKHLSWLHISDIHVKSGDSYDRDVVLNALLKSMARFGRRHLTPDMIFFTGDVAYSGKESEYQCATSFFEMLLKELRLTKDALFVIPGNHDVDRSLGTGLARTLASQAASNDYFRQGTALLHVAQRQEAFFKWHDEFFSGVRRAARETTCGPYESRKFGDFNLGVLPINTAAFCLADDDSGKLWVGRRCLDEAMSADREPADLTIALMHHPLDWLHEIERAQIKTGLYENVDCILRGHLHQSELEQIDGTSGSALHLAAGASYQGSEWPNKATFVEVYDESLRVVPIRFDDQPSPRWNIDTSMFPDSEDFSGTLRWKRRPSGEEKNVDTEGGRRSALLVPVLEHPSTPIQAIGSEDAALRNFERDLFISPTGKLIYVEPRLSTTSQSSITRAESDVPFTNLEDIVHDTASYVIRVPSEYGSTSISKRLALEFTRAGAPVELRDALTLPNYRAKLRSEFPEINSKERKNYVLILDNFSFYQHEKLFKEIQSLDLFVRFVVLTTTRGIDRDIAPLLIDDGNSKMLFLWSMSRGGIREMASALIDSADTTHLSAVVEKVYGDLLALSIPLTPSNVVMYLKVLDKELDFHPFNRVDIVQKYLSGALSGASELLVGSFTSREKIDILAEFAYTLFLRSASFFVEKDWFDFCNGYMEDKLSAFSAIDLLRGLEENRVLVRYEERVYFKYSFFLSFLVGRHLTNHPDIIDLLRKPARSRLSVADQNRRARA